MLWYTEPTCTIYRPEKTSEKWPRVLKLSFKIGHYKKLPISTLPKNLRWSELRCTTCRPDLYNLKTKKS